MGNMFEHPLVLFGNHKHNPGTPVSQAAFAKYHALPEDKVISVLEMLTEEGVPLFGVRLALLCANKNNVGPQEDCVPWPCVNIKRLRTTSGFPSSFLQDMFGTPM